MVVEGVWEAVPQFAFQTYICSHAEARLRGKLSRRGKGYSATSSSLFSVVSRGEGVELPANDISHITVKVDNLWSTCG